MPRPAARLLAVRAIVLLAATAAPAPSSAQAAPKPMLGGSPKVSPDGSRILFASNREGTHALYVMRADGSGATRLTRDTTSAFPGGWSPDGGRIVYVAGGAEGERIVVMSADGRGARELPREKGDQTPSWSHDGREIVFGSGTFPTIDIHAMAADGGPRRNLTRAPYLQYDPVWSPDGTRIAYIRAERGVGPKLWIMNADGSGQLLIGRDAGAHERPAWSPDGRRIAYQSTDRQNRADSHIVVLDVASGEERRITTHETPYHDETPSWFPDGERLAIQSDRDGRWALYVVDLTGRTLVKLTP